ncbi:AAA family ATPase [Hymenobacter sp. ASUV-10]|uniref:AAA family ATPase n=1 Tax=Hymenobacter aranciens TaxID=3063996 RepID=A0ABT9BB30_9BACT|nr:AAA family ATPase [Hymenobacter sp. ASUV-10]MDO7875480.1 AAA family ATPase [Hymenobacter sp. ASUV-10]
MLKHLNIRNFTVFAEADFEFSKGLNVIVGTNGTGKSHVLKLGYAVLKGLNSQLNEALAERYFTDTFLGTILLDVFRPAPNNLDELIRRSNKVDDAKLAFTLYNETIRPGDFTCSSDGTAMENPFIINVPSVPLSTEAATTLLNEIGQPVYIPAKEILTLGWILPASKQLVLPIDKSYLDLLTQLSGLSLQQPEPAAATAIKELANDLKGEVQEEGGRYYLVYPKQPRMEMTMVAEGLRKFGTLQKLLANGSLTSKATLFWDEPEANLNPALLRKLAAVLLKLAGQGYQIILATHSLFLLKEFHILAQREPTPIRYFGLYEGPDGATQVETTDDFETLEHIAALDAELAQTVDFQQALDHNDAN